MKLHDGKTMLVRINGEVVRRDIADITKFNGGAESFATPVLLDGEAVHRTHGDPIPTIIKTK